METWRNITKRQRFKLRGIVLGKLWMGGKAAYPARESSGDDSDLLIKKAKEDLESKSLDAGMGFEYLMGAMLTLETITIISHEGKDYHRSDFEILFIGDLNFEEKEFLARAEAGL